jgi:hypothetical protein
VGTYVRVLSCQALNDAASQEPSSVGAYPMLKAPRRGSQELGYVLSPEMRWVGLTGSEILSVHVYRGGVSVGVDYAGFNSF